MRYVIAFDSFKGSLTALEACEAARKGLERTMKKPGDTVVALPVSDGGDGMLDAFAHGRRYERRRVLVHDALMRPCMAEYLVEGRRAVIESAQACGLLRVSDVPPRPLQATTYGVGEMVADAISHGCRDLVVGLGGSATSDCGIGMLRALKEILPGKEGNGGRPPTWGDVLMPDDLRITVAADVDNPLDGPNGAARVFGPQKGASAHDIQLLDRRAHTFAACSAKCLGRDCSRQPGAGAAGGLGYAFLEFLGARMASGAELLLDDVGFDGLLDNVRCVFTGEGSVDGQTLMGKAASVILGHCRRRHVPVVLLAGRVIDKKRLLDAGFARVDSINPPGLSPEEAMRKETAARNLEKRVAEIALEENL